MLRFLSALIFCLLATVLFAQKSLLQSGPMLGYTDMLETMLWVQTNTSAKVQITYWNQEKPGEKFFTDAVATKKTDGYTAHLVADAVQPGQRYGYDLRINDQPVTLGYPTEFQTQALWQYRTDPPPFRVALGSCAYVNEPVYDRPGNTYGGEYQIFSAIHQQRPDLMLWLGDNTYLREPDWYTRTGFLHRYTHTRSLPELQPLLASTHHYAIWDDHDFGPNDSDGSLVQKEMSQEIFKLFWVNPTYGLPGEGGITSQFQWADVDFFLLDDRYFRTANNRKTGERQLLGKVQMEWLLNALAASKASFKLVAIGGQVLNTVEEYETYIHLCPQERSYLLRRIEEEGLKNVVFVTGDRHHTELSQVVNANQNTVYDLTVSPLTSATHKTDEKNTLRVEGTLVDARNFGILEFAGPQKERIMTIRIFDSSGKELWTKVIRKEI